MAAEPSWRLVIDVSVTAAASSRTDLPDDTPRKCREFLDAVLQICHRIVLSPELMKEWRSHRSRYAKTWLTRMYARKKVFPLKRMPRDREFARAVFASTESEAEKKALAKDLHLVEAALATDSIIVSRDKEAQRLYRRAAFQVARLDALAWSNPLTDPNPAAWLSGEERPPKLL